MVLISLCGVEIINSPWTRPVNTDSVYRP